LSSVDAVCALTQEQSPNLIWYPHP
jgi:hypothetical protein